MFGILIGLIGAVLSIGAIIGVIILIIGLARNPSGTVQSIRSYSGHSSFRFAFIVVLCLGVMIPVAMVSEMVGERAERYRSVLDDISNTWGKEQTLLGPFLIVPYDYDYKRIENYTKKDGTNATRQVIDSATGLAAFLPETLGIDASLDPQYRARGIYQSLVYNSEIHIKGTFVQPDFSAFTVPVRTIHWNKAYLSLGLTDTHALHGGISVTWNDKAVPFEPGSRYTELLPSGMNADVALSEGREQAFDIHLKTKGSQGFWFAPVGKITEAKITSPWINPSFKGSVLPEKYEIGKQDFWATWSIPHLARTYPQGWLQNDAPTFNTLVTGFTVGVQLFEPINLYSVVERATKYALLFVGLTFFAFFLFEHTSGVRMHFVQYILIGCAVAMFYLMILSFAEHIGFTSAYLIAAGIVIAMVGAYTYAALRQWKKTALIVSILSGLYAVLYSILHMEDYALLAGTLLLLAVLSVAMYVTRKMHLTPMLP